MALETIRRNGYRQEDRTRVEETVATAVEANPDLFIEKYKADERSFEGRYIAADLFKETFEQYKVSKDSRNRYNGPVHNAAAVLSAELFRRNLADKNQAERDTVVFLTGTPGSGKTSSVLSAGKLPSSYRVVFEGQLSNPQTTLEKIQQVLDAGLKPVIIAVHARPENALDNTLLRFAEQGRGASIHVMCSIQGGLPASLREVHSQFGNAVELHVVDYRDRMKPATHSGWNHLPLLESEGNHDHIKQRLSIALEKLRSAGSISEPAYRQANGDPPLERDASMAGPSHGRRKAHDGGRGIPPPDRKKAVLSETHSNPLRAKELAHELAHAFLHLPEAQAIEQHPDLTHAFAACKNAEQQFKVNNPATELWVKHAVMQGFRDQLADKLRAGELINPPELERERQR